MCLCAGFSVLELFPLFELFEPELGLFVLPVLLELEFDLFSLLVLFLLELVLFSTLLSLKTVEKEERAAKKAANLYKPDEFRPLVYICSPYRGDTEKNVEKARKYSRFAIESTRAMSL